MNPYYADDAVTLYHGDCLEVLPTLADKSIDHVITDPPYDEHTHSKQRVGGSDAPKRNGRGDTVLRASFSRSKDLGFEAMDHETLWVVCREAARLTRRWVLIYSNIELADTWRTALVSNGLEYIRTGAWIKRGCTPQFTGDRPAQGFEAITIAHPKGRKRWNGGGRVAVWSHSIVLNKFTGDTRRVHTTQKPIELMRELVSLFTDPGELVLDPFAGSGTTARACKDLGRRCILIEREEKYCEIAAKRMAQEALPLERPRTTEQHALSFEETGS